MGKIILEFDSIEEQDDARMALDGVKWKVAMWDLDQTLRSTVKHGISIIEPNTQASDIEIDVADKLRENLREILTSYGLKLED